MLKRLMLKRLKGSCAGARAVWAATLAGTGAAAGFSPVAGMAISEAGQQSEAAQRSAAVAGCVVEIADAPRRLPAQATYGDQRLAALIEEGLASNPQVRGARAAWQASLHRVPQATARPDPMLMLTQHVRPPETRVGPQIAMLSVSQRFPGFGKLGLQGQVAAAAAGAQGELHQAQRDEFVRLVKRAWHDLAFIDQSLAISRESEDLLARYEGLARARYAQGFGVQADVVRMQAEYTRALSRRDDLERRRWDALATIAALLARPDAMPGESGEGVEPVEPVPLPPVTASAEDLAAAGRRDRPEVRAALRRIESRERAVALARRSRWPDFDVGVVWGTLLDRDDPAGRAAPPPDNGRDVISLTAGVALPVFGQRHQAGVREAAESASQACAMYEGAVAEMERAVRSALSWMRSAERQLALFEDALLPQTEQALYSTEAAYSTGTAGVLDLLDGERRLLDVRLGLARIRTDYMKALADLERAVGSPVANEDAPSGPGAPAKEDMS